MLMHARLCPMLVPCILYLMMASLAIGQEDLTSATAEQEDPSCKLHGQRALVQVISRVRSETEAPAQPPETLQPTCPNRGTLELDRCWYLSEVGGNCADTCGKQGLGFFWRVPSGGKSSNMNLAIVPKLLGRKPGTESAPWGRLECFVPSEDRYHTAKPEADQNTLDTADVKAWSYSKCQLACPCSTEEALPVHPASGSSAALLSTKEPSRLATSALEKQRSGLLNVAAASNGGKCIEQSSSYAEEGIDGGFGCSLMLDNDLSDGYYSAWASKGQGKDASVTLAFKKPYMLEFLKYQQRPDAGEWNKDVDLHFADGTTQSVTLRNTPEMQTIPLTPVVSDKLVLTVTSAYKTTNNGATEVQVLGREVQPPCPGGGSLVENRCWLLSQKGGSCRAACAAKGLTFSYVLPRQGDIMLQLLGKAPKTASGPWGRLECFVEGEDRYHSAQRLQAKNTLDRGDPQDWSYPGCQLACPCMKP